MEDIEKYRWQSINSILTARSFILDVYFRQFQGSDKFLSIIYSVERQANIVRAFKRPNSKNS